MSQMMTTSVQMILHERKETLDAPDMAEEESEPVALEHTDSGRSSPVERVDTQRLQREIDRRRADSAQGAQASDPMGLMVGLDELVAEGHEPIFMDRLHGVAAVQRFRTAFAAVTRLLESSSSPLRLRFDERHSPPLRPSSRGAQSGDVVCAFSLRDPTLFFCAMITRDFPMLDLVRLCTPWRDRTPSRENSREQPSCWLR